ncbi:4002_t:CDS:2 [Acaulospora morrowiae]|uniref:4002_t:CDS:1 n=1 Tax=Acaulospora morrowiae TaxID=94023 RepID=A0A9N9HL02_9GLOM|nr:4002_t:CDS:2 [Acaulospora morrowiae]
MASKEQTTKLIGDYLLAGWVLTDKICQTPNCNVPLLRSKDSVTWFCVDCDKRPGEPKVNVKQQTTNDLELSHDVQDILLKAEEVNRQGKDSLNSQFSSIVSTPISEEMISDEQRLRREQSQRASHSIGRYLLSGWALIDEICPNGSCFAVPLVRDRNKRKYCVNCQNYYVSESDLDLTKHKIVQSDVSQLESLSVENESTTKHELKHGIGVKEVESTLKFENARDIHVRDQPLSSEARLKGTRLDDTLQESISSLSSTLGMLNSCLEATTMISDVKEICDAIKSCAQALEVLVSLKQKKS